MKTREPTEMETRVIRATCHGFTTSGTWSEEEGSRSGPTVHHPCWWPECQCGDGPLERAKASIQAMADAPPEFLDDIAGFFMIPRHRLPVVWRTFMDTASPPEKETT